MEYNYFESIKSIESIAYMHSRIHVRMIILSRRIKLQKILKNIINEKSNLQNC
jgi:hypothetical protein